MLRDPVCSGEIDETSAWYSTYEGKKYYFTSAECKADFDRDPGRYVAAGAGAAGEAEIGIERRAGKAASRARAKIQTIISERKNRTAERIGAVSDALRTASQRLRDQNQEAVAGYTDRAAARVDRFTGYLKSREAEQMINDAEDYIRSRPVLVIGGAFAAGFLAARFLKSSKTITS